MTIGFRGSDAAKSVLVDYVGSAKHDRVRERAIKALSEYPDDPTVQRVVYAALHDPALRVRESASEFVRRYLEE